MKKEFVTLALSEIIPYENNPRINDEAVEDVIESIKQCENLDPIEVDENNVILAGHTRLKALQELGYTETECIRYSGLTEEQKKKYRLLSNKTGEKAEWDLEKLKIELADLDFGDFDFGFDLPEDEKDVEIVEVEIPEEVETRCKLGDVWQLGEHRLICGDSTSAEVVGALMETEQAEVVLTDPPYNVNYGDKAEYLDKYLNKGHRNKSHIKNDDMDSASFYYFLFDAFSRVFDIAKEGAAVYVFHSENEGINFRTAFVDAGWKLSQCLIWNKNAFVLGRNDYQWKHEPILYGWKEGAPHYFTDDRTQATVIEDMQIDPTKMKKAELIELVKQMLSDKISTTVINENKPAINDIHPTMKPIALLARLIKNSSRIGQNIIDPFGGSGSTLIACEQLKRKCYMCELDPHYCDVIIQRWENFTGKEAVLIGDGE